MTLSFNIHCRRNGQFQKEIVHGVKIQSKLIDALEYDFILHPAMNLTDDTFTISEYSTGLAFVTDNDRQQLWLRFNRMMNSMSNEFLQTLIESKKKLN